MDPQTLLLQTASAGEEMPRNCISAPVTPNTQPSLSSTSIPIIGDLSAAAASVHDVKAELGSMLLSMGKWRQENQERPDARPRSTSLVRTKIVGRSIYVKLKKWEFCQVRKCR
jgi:hypothetical protein